MSIVIPQQYEEFIRNEIASGKYRSESEVICAGLGLLQERERAREAIVEDLQIGIDQLAEGKGIVVANEEAHQQFFQDIKERGRQRLAAKRTSM